MEPFDLRNWKQETNAPLIIDQVAIDSRRVFSKNALFVALQGASFDGHDFLFDAMQNGARYALVKKGFIPKTPLPTLTLLYVDNPLDSLQEIAACYRKERKAKVIAITGSFGKTMLKDLLGKIISEKQGCFISPESFNSQIGVALSLLKIKDSDTIALIEAAVTKPQEMKRLAKMLQPDHVIITNRGSKRIGTQSEQIGHEMLDLVTALLQENWAVVPDGTDVPNRKLVFWNSLPIEKQNRTECDALHYSLTLSTGKAIQGAIPDGLFYQLELLQIAVTTAELLEIESHFIEKALADYVPEQMSIELFKSSSGALIINDTYSQDPMSCDVALRQLDSIQSTTRIFLFGGLRFSTNSNNNDLERISQAICAHKIDTVILWEERAAAVLKNKLPHTKVLLYNDEKSALIGVKELLNPGVVLLVKGAKKIALKYLVSTLEESPPNNQVIINLAVIQANIEEIKRKIGPTIRIMVMVKALAYGTDDIRIAKFLQSCRIDILGLSYVEEAVSMRKAGVTQDLFVLNAALYEAEKAIKWDLEVGVSEPLLIDALQKYAALHNKKARVHLHIDTGMSRFGCPSDRALSLAKQIASSPNLILEGIMTHLAAADDPLCDAFTHKQAADLENTILQLESSGHFPTWRHACNSSGTLRFNFSKFNMIRIGLALYGLHASQHSKNELDLRPAISLLSRIVGINECVKGDTIGYGRSYVIEKERARIAVLPIGYFDGLHRNYSSKGYSLIHGKKAPMVGCICMDYMMVDISDIEDAKIGDEVLIFGEDANGHYRSPEELATSGGSIVHELMTCLGPRIRRFFIYDESLRPR